MRLGRIGATPESIRKPFQHYISSWTLYTLSTIMPGVFSFLLAVLRFIGLVVLQNRVCSRLLPKSLDKESGVWVAFLNRKTKRAVFSWIPKSLSSVDRSYGPFYSRRLIVNA